MALARAATKMAPPKAVNAPYNARALSLVSSLQNCTFVVSAIPSDEHDELANCTLSDDLFDAFVSATEVPSDQDMQASAASVAHAQADEDFEDEEKANDFENEVDEDEFETFGAFGSFSDAAAHASSVLRAADDRFAALLAGLTHADREFPLHPLPIVEISAFCTLTGVTIKRLALLELCHPASRHDAFDDASASACVDSSESLPALPALKAVEMVWAKTLVFRVKALWKRRDRGKALVSDWRELPPKPKLQPKLQRQPKSSQPSSRPKPLPKPQQPSHHS